MIMPTILSCTSPPTISEKMSCEIEYKSYRKNMVTFCIDFKSENTLNLSNSTFMLVSRKSTMKDSKKQRCRFYKRSNSYNHLNCSKEIYLLTETTSTSTLSYYIGVGDIFHIRIKKFDFGQKLTKGFSSLKKTDVKIDGFYEVPKLKKTVLKVIPPNTSDEKRINYKHFNVSASDLC